MGTPDAALTPDLTDRDGNAVQDFKGKVNLLYKVLLPEPPGADLRDIIDYTYSPPAVANSSRARSPGRDPECPA